ncbi:hypothetical protein LCGC14_0978150 [marine sediment metagenome]|uniref:Uncharacterized protein n=1 Tax=marine sediment metagenome TaxID=412755 RepID=A0A0F9NVU8_9ZZZZ
MGFGIKQADVAAIKAVTDNLPDAGALSDLATLLAAASPEIAQILADTGELQTDLVDGGRLDLLVDAIKATTDNLPNSGALNDLAAILADTGTTLPAILAAIPTTMRGTDGAALASAWTAALATALGNYTAVRAGNLDELAAANLPTDVAAVSTNLARDLPTLDFWSDTQEELLINAAAGDKTLPTVTVAGLPGGATIVRAVAMFKFRMVENLYAGANAINVAQHIQVRDDTPGTWRDAISIADNLFNFSEAAREGGDIFIGDHDIVAEVDGNDSYNFQWESADADQISLNFNDIQVGLKIWYSK